MKLVYLLIDDRPFVPFKEKWRIFEDKERCLTEARKLGFGSGPFGEMFPLGDEPGIAVRTAGEGIDLTVVPILVEGLPVPVPVPAKSEPIMDCTCAVSLWKSTHLPGCPHGLRTGKMYPTWADVPDDVLVPKLYEERHGRLPPVCPVCSSRIYDNDKGECGLCATKARISALKARTST